MRLIELTQGKQAVVDMQDYAVLSRYKWMAVRDANNMWYAVTRTRPYTNSYLRMHRIILDARPGQAIDHINGDGLDNRRSNLRWCNESQNQANSCKRLTYAGRPTSSRFKGVSWHRNKKHWGVHICHHDERRYVGTYRNEAIAAMAYDLAALKAFGSYARSNFAVLWAWLPVIQGFRP